MRYRICMFVGWMYLTLGMTIMVYFGAYTTVVNHKPAGQGIVGAGLGLAVCGVIIVALRGAK